MNELDNISGGEDDGIYHSGNTKRQKGICESKTLNNKLQHVSSVSEVFGDNSDQAWSRTFKLRPRL
jgi:hypothetical protein